MEKKKSILNGSLIAGAMIAVTSFTANASGIFNYNHLGTGEEVRIGLLKKGDASKNLELKCGSKAKDSSMKKGKDGKCGEGKCGDKKKGMKKGSGSASKM